MKISMLLLFAVTLSASATADKWPCDKSKAPAAFAKKKQTNPWPDFKNDPYKNQTTESNRKIQETLANKDLVCTIKYASNSDRIDYELRQFSNKQEAERNGYIVTHQGKCGACSNLKDLAVYLRSPDLTDPIRR